jgi:hypothetical protein
LARARLLRPWIAVVASLVVAWTAPARAQRGGNYSNFFGCGDPPTYNVPYDGRFAFLRLKYDGTSGNCYYQGEPSWAHGFGYTQYGTAESHLMSIMQEITSLRPHLDATNVLGLESPDLFKYPVSFLVEAGFLTITDGEATNLRKYLTRGGFLIIDDSRNDGRGSSWYNMEAGLRKVLPKMQVQPLPITHPIFHSYFDIPSFNIIPQAYDRGQPEFYAIFEGNDPKKRLMVLINFGQDMSQYWEFSPQGLYPVPAGQEAYKLGVNYLFYALTH